ncbi:MAG: 30S ribosomal protein S21 [Nitrospirae bacterium]|nr:30S ribosomal protein S21 [Nitrospirota bacterium]MBI3352823.1 30S ribosomal protein S21 [Nitrospirota bacterium]
MEVKVYNNEVARALKYLSKKMIKEGVMKEIKKRKFYEKPSVKKKRKQKEAIKKRLKAEKFEFHD